MTTAECTEVAASDQDARALKVRVESRSSTDATRKVVVALTIFAALRILFFVLVFPLFNNVDEKLHFLTIRMYAQGHFPGKDLPHIDPEFVRTFLLYWSPEYDHTEEFIREKISPPLYRLSPQGQDAALAQGYYKWKLDEVPHRLNFEAQGAPLYYLVAAAWYDVGAALGLNNWHLAYWLRLLNPISYGLLVWLSYRFVCKAYPDREFLCLAVPALIAVFPQDVFFGMNRDVFSPTLWAAALLIMLDIFDSTKNQTRSLMLASGLVGLTFLVEVSNFVLYAALVITLWTWFHRSQESRQSKLWVVSASLAAGLLPPLIWMTRNFLVIGDLTGSKAKIRNFGWTVKPFFDMWQHPIFSWNGLSFFLVKLTRSIWHGDYDWHATAMRSATADWFYLFSSGVMVLIFMLDFARRRRNLSSVERWTGLQTILLVAGLVVFMAAISMTFDYHNHGYPSRLHPFFVSGRIISGGLLPFVLIYASGLGWIAELFRKWIPPKAVLACLLLLITASELRVRKAAFFSPYNFFAISRWQR